MSDKKAGQRTLVTFLLDRTGAALGIRDQTINAFNAYLDTLKAGGDLIDFTLILFDEESFDPIYVCTPIRDVPNFKPRNLVSRRKTPLFKYNPPRGLALLSQVQVPLVDATWKAIAMTADALQRYDDRPNVVICIQVDGKDDRFSTERTWEEINTLITDKAAYGWQFVFLGAGVGVAEQTYLMGIPRSQVVKYQRIVIGAMRKVFLTAASNILALARGERMDAGFSTQQKANIGKRLKEIDLLQVHYFWVDPYWRRR